MVMRLPVPQAMLSPFSRRSAVAIWSVVFHRVSITESRQTDHPLMRFCSPTLPPPPPTSTHTIHAAIMRATQPSFGSIVLAGFVLTRVRILGFLMIALRRFPAYLPLPARPILQPLVFVSVVAVGYLENATSSLGVMDMVIFRTIFFELLVFFTFTLLTLNFAY